jgi:hypothetical protein
MGYSKVNTNVNVYEWTEVRKKKISGIRGSKHQKNLFHRVSKPRK